MPHLQLQYISDLVDDRGVISKFLNFMKNEFLGDFWARCTAQRKVRAAIKGGARGSGGHAVPHDLADGGAGGVRASGRRRKTLLSVLTANVISFSSVRF